MKQVITKQGKTFDYSEILLFNVSNDNIVVILNDKEQLDKFSLSGNSKDAPIAVIPYSEEELKEIISTMKEIVGYRELSPNEILVEYGDDGARYNTKVIFDISNKEIIENNLIEKRKSLDNYNNSVGNWYDTEQNKETSTVVTEEHRFKVLQIEKYEEQEKEYKGKVNLGFFASCMTAITLVLIISTEKIWLSGIFAYDTILSIMLMAESIAMKANIKFRKEDLIKELSEAGVDIDMIRAAIQNEEEKGKGAK